MIFIDSFRSQALGTLSVFVATVLALVGTVPPGSAGMVIASAQLLCTIAYWLINDYKVSFKGGPEGWAHTRVPHAVCSFLASRQQSEFHRAHWRVFHSVSGSPCRHRGLPSARVLAIEHRLHCC